MNDCLLGSYRAGKRPNRVLRGSTSCRQFRFSAARFRPTEAPRVDVTTGMSLSHRMARQGIGSIIALLLLITAAKSQIPNEVCLGCHGNEGFAIPGPDGQMRSLYLSKDKFEHSVHGKRSCTECHRNITAVPHEKTEVVVGCVQCHEDLWKSAQKDPKAAHELGRLGTVVQQIDRYMKSIHARPNIHDQSRTNATCYNCHDAHYVYPPGSAIRTEWRLNIPNVCGKCHARERELYATSVHGQEVLQKHNAAAAVCSDCHTTHDVEDPAKDVTKLVITKNCGGCHSESFKSYTQTYHGQVQTLGYAYTAKCFDCHGSHTIQRVSDSASSVHATHRLQTCQTCHQNATAGFLTFQPHANTHDLARYPYTWLASKFMLGLLGGTFAFFWTHTALWFYREYKERKEGRNRLHVRTDELLQEPGKYYERWGVLWRIAHLAFAISLMVLVLTGMTAFYADSAWAPIVVQAFGGPKVTAAIHRVCAVIFLGVFFAHLVYVVIHIGRNWRTFKWFGPDSLIPNWQDIKDILAMFLWFLGRKPRPVFDRWTYWEKFDYWAPFWGVTIIGASGLMLWMPTITASFLPGWIFNVATIAHGEEAVLAAGFLFTVHFFNNHFRPDKFPLDIQMFTGAMPLEEFRKDHTVQFRRLVETGQLEKYLVSAPSRPMTLGSRILGATLIIVGLILLILVGVGFFGSLARG